MKDTIVTIRMPSNLIHKLHDQVEQGYFLDLSEALRSIIREKYLETASLSDIVRRSDIEKREGIKDKRKEKESAKETKESAKERKIKERGGSG